MRRLVDRELGSQSLEAEAARLLGAVGPHEPPVGMKQRVRAKIFALPVAPRRLVPRAAWAAALLVTSVAAAAGTLWIVRAPAPAPQGVTPSRPALHPAPDPAHTSAPAEAPTVVSEEPASARPTASTPSRNVPKADGPTEENLLFEATRALRREGDPSRAMRLLQEYRQKFPRGALAEEALALSIEAAEARGDGNALVLAKRYLKLYPKGHFVDKAKRALERNDE